MITELEFNEFRKTEEYSNDIKNLIDCVKLKNNLEDLELYLKEKPMKDGIIYDFLLCIGRNWMQDNMFILENLINLSDSFKLSYCYLEEYDKGRKARLREKSSGRHVNLNANDKYSKTEFLKFLSQIKRYSMSVGKDNTTIFDRYKKNDCVVVLGRVLKDNYEKLDYVYDEYLTYFCVNF